MDRFEFFFSIYSLLLGFALAELMLGFANLLRAPRRPNWGVLTPVLAVLIFIEILVTFLDAWMKLQRVELNLLGLLVPTLTAVAYFVAAVIAVPRRADEWTSLDDYFDDRKKWILGLLTAQFLMNTLLVELPMFLYALFRTDWGTGMTEWVIANILFAGLHLAPIFTRNFWGNLLPLLALIGLFFYYYGNYTLPELTPAPAHAPAPASASGTAPGSPPPAPAR